MSEPSVRFQYFQHQLNARKDEKLRKLLIKEGWAGVGLFWGLLEDLGLEKSHRLECDYETLSFDMHAPAELIQRVVENYGLFRVNKGYFTSIKLNEFMEAVEEKYQRRAEAGKKGGKAKAMLKQTDSNATAMPEQCQPLKEDKIREEEKREDNNTCLSPSPDVEAENKHDAVASNGDAATTEEFNFSEQVSDREYLAITRQYMLKYAAAPTQFTDRLIALMAPDKWMARGGTDFIHQKENAAELFIKVDAPEKYKHRGNGQCTKQERQMVDVWLGMLREARIFDRDALNMFRGCNYDEPSNTFILTVADEPSARYFEAHHVQSLAPVLRRLYGQKVGLQYNLLAKEEK